MGLLLVVAMVSALCVVMVVVTQDNEGGDLAEVDVLVDVLTNVEGSMNRAVGILQELIKAHTNKTEVREFSQSWDQIRKKGVDGEEKVRKRRKRTTIWRDLVEMEKDATLQDIRKLRDTLVSLSRSLGDFAEVLRDTNLPKLLSSYRREVGVWILLLGRLQEAPPTKAAGERVQQQGLTLTDLETRLQDISAIDDDQVDEVEALVKDLVAASQKTKEALELVSLTTSTEDKNLVKNASEPFNRVASLDPVANQTGQNEEKSTKRNKLIAKTANRTGQTTMVEGTELERKTQQKLHLQ